METFSSPPVLEPIGTQDTIGGGTLTKRQRQALHLIYKGLRNVELAHQLHVSERTAKRCVSELLVLFDASNRTELVGRALATGAIDLSH